MKRIKAPAFSRTVLTIRAPIQFKRGRQLQLLKVYSSRTDIHFHINSTIDIRPVKRNKLSFSSTEINKQLPTLVYNSSQIKLKFRSQLQLIPQFRWLLKLRLEYQHQQRQQYYKNIIRKVSNVKQEVGKEQYQERSPEELQHQLDIFAKTYHPQPLEVVYY